MPQSELEVAKPLISRKVMCIVVAVCGLLITAGFFHKSGRARTATDTVVSWGEERRARNEAEEAGRIAQANREAAWRKRCEWLRDLPVDTRPPLAFNGAQKTMPDVPLRTDCWSRQIEIPAGKSVSWSVSPGGHYLVFGDGFLDDVMPGGPPRQYNGHPGPIRMLAKCEGQTVSLEVQTPLATLKNNPP